MKKRKIFGIEIEYHPKGDRPQWIRLTGKNGQKTKFIRI